MRRAWSVAVIVSWLFTAGVAISALWADLWWPQAIATTLLVLAGSTMLIAGEINDLTKHIERRR